MKKRIFLISMIAMVVAVAVILIVRHRAATPKDPATSQLVSVERGSVRKTVTADGTLRALTAVAVKSDAGGKVVPKESCMCGGASERGENSDRSPGECRFSRQRSQGQRRAN